MQIYNESEHKATIYGILLTVRLTQTVDLSRLDEFNPPSG